MALIANKTSVDERKYPISNPFQVSWVEMIANLPEVNRCSGAGPKNAGDFRRQRKRGFSSSSRSGSQVHENDCGALT